MPPTDVTPVFSLHTNGGKTTFPMNDAEPTKRPTTAAVFAALLPFLGGPLGLVIFALAVNRGEGGVFENLAEAWAEGGFAMYLVLLAGAVITLLSAVAVFFGVQRGSPFVGIGAPLAAGIVAAGAVGTYWGVTQAARAVAHASPADRAPIMAAATGEALSSGAFGHSGAAGLLFGLALACLLGVAVQQGAARKMLFFTAAAFGVLALIDAASLYRLSSVRSAMQAVAHINPADRLAILMGSTEEIEASRWVFLGLVGALLVVLAVGAVVAKGAPRAMALLPLFGLAGLAGQGAQLAAQSLSERTATEVTPPASAAKGLVELDGYDMGADPTWCLKGDELVSCADTEGDRVSPEELRETLASIAAQWRDLHEAAGEANARVTLHLPFGVYPKAGAAPLWQAVDAASAAHSNLALVGERAVKPVNVASELRVLAPYLLSLSRTAYVDLAFEQEQCAKGCDFATVKGDELHVGTETWRAEKPVYPFDDLTEVTLLKADRTMAPLQLMNLALAAAAHERRLTVVLPGARPDDDGPTEAEDRDEETAIDDENAEAEDDLPAKELIRNAVKSHSDEVKVCYETALKKAPTLAGRVVLTWVVDRKGVARNIEITENGLGRSKVAECIAGRLKKWAFPKSVGDELVTVSYPWVFKTAN